MAPLEIEVKFFLEDADQIRRAIAAIGAEGRGRWFEKNVCFDDAQQRLRREKSLLRLRQDRRARLTFKKAPPQSQAGQTGCKIMQEFEIEVSDFRTTAEILEGLGFHPAITYEKWRETYILGEVHLLIDTLPFGVFLEIEGPAELIRKTALSLGLSWERRILTNYLELFEHLKAELKLAFNDLTFENFKTFPVDFTKWRHLFEAEAG